MDEAVAVAEGDFGLWEGGPVRDRLVVSDAASVGTAGNIEGWLWNVLVGDN